MGKSFAITIILSSILIAQVMCRIPYGYPYEKYVKDFGHDSDDTDLEETDDDNDDDDQEESASEDEESEEETDIDEEARPSLPFLTCSVFDNDFACNAMCSVLRSIYGTPISSGVCEGAKECECQVLPDATLQDYWNEKFLAKNTLREILQDKELSGEILKVLKTPFKTAQQTIEDLKPLLSQNQLSSLRFRNKSAQKIFSNDGGLDKVAVQKYVANKLKSLEKPSEGSDYKKTLFDVLNNPDNKDIVDYIINEIRQSKNKLLNGVIEEYSKEHGNKIDHPAVYSKAPESIIDILDTAVINELITLPPRENVLKLTELRFKPKKLSSETARNVTN